MKLLFNSLLIFITVIMLGSCATIFSRSNYPVNISSSPEGVNISIENREKRVIYTGNTPAAIKLKSASGYMKREDYTITFSKDGYTTKTITVSANLDAWFFGNLVLGGFIGMLIIDPASGAMYKIADREINESLVLNENAAVEKHELIILDKNDLPAEISADNLIRIE